MLEYIELKNFKAHHNTQLHLKPISIFIGPNNSGKSSIIQALQLMKQSIKKKQRNFIPRKQNSIEVNLGTNNPNPFHYEGLALDIGDFHDVCSVGNDMITIGYSGSHHVEGNDFYRYSGPIELVMKVGIKDNNVHFQSGSIKSKKFEYTWKYDTLNGGQNQSKIITSNDFQFQIQPQGNISQPMIISDYKYINDKVKDQMMGLEMSPYIFSNGNENIHNDFCETLKFIYGIRGLEEKSYHLINRNSNNIEYSILYDRNLALVNMFPYNRDLEDNISGWFERILGLKVRFEMKPGKVTLQTSKSKKHRSLIGEGLGSQQLLSMLVPIALSNRGDTIFIEEPEIHLHPKAQSDLVEFFYKAKEDKNLQFVIATHSEHILLKFLNLVALTRISQNDIGIYSFNNDDGEMKIDELEINSRGMVKGGLPGFFDESINIMDEFLSSIKEKPEE